MQEIGTEEMESAYRIVVGKPEWKKQLEKYIERRIILNWVLKKQDAVTWVEFTELMRGSNSGLLWTQQ